MSISSSTGIGSGMDINGIVSQLIQAEGKPQFDAITRQETATQTRLSGLGTLKSSLSTFQTAVKKLLDVNLFKTTQAVSANPSIFTATTGPGSVAGSHTVEVTKLAKAQQSIATTEYANSAAAVTVTGGTLNFTYGPGSTKTPFSATIGPNATLTDVRDAINAASGNNGVTASIINVDSTVTPGTTISKLVLTSKDTGVANGFAVAVTGGDAGLNLLDTSVPANYSTVTADDAVIKVDGLDATRSTNTITDVLSGVTLNLQSAAVGTIVNLNVNLDNAAINKTITDFVTAYNSLHTTTASLGFYGGTAKGATNGSLLGNSTLRNISNNLRQDASNPVTSATSSYDSLAMIGITIDKSGVMALDSTKLNAALASNLSAVSDVFASANGVAVRLDTKLTQFLQSGGPLDSQQTSLSKTLTTLGKQRTAIQLRLDNLQKGLQKQFIAMDLAVGQFKSTSAFLTQRFG
ncbi:flagellar filament capping protein FliD [Methylobacter sp.]|uniref:flagellar filament capping protein FliD n=1 Tax=Methylobacter sp. TaxID=2051955 RepID=UPI001222622C|nr:flagellar filament capping protein FliD [Methylobacter sp.]TAK63011.1 MAG: flagellar hook protein [Methylobacter sp.]